MASFWDMLGGGFQKGQSLLSGATLGTLRGAGFMDKDSGYRPDIDDPLAGIAAGWKGQIRPQDISREITGHEDPGWFEKFLVEPTENLLYDPLILLGALGKAGAVGGKIGDAAKFAGELTKGKKAAEIFNVGGKAAEAARLAGKTEEAATLAGAGAKASTGQLAKAAAMRAVPRTYAATLANPVTNAEGQEVADVPSAFMLGAVGGPIVGQVASKVIRGAGPTARYIGQKVAPEGSQLSQYLQGRAVGNSLSTKTDDLESTIVDRPRRGQRSPADPREFQPGGVEPVPGTSNAPIDNNTPQEPIPGRNGRTAADLYGVDKTVDLTDAAAKRSQGMSNTEFADWLDNNMLRGMNDHRMDNLLDSAAWDLVDAKPHHYQEVRDMMEQMFQRIERGEQLDDVDYNVLRDKISSIGDEISAGYADEWNVGNRTMEPTGNVGPTGPQTIRPDQADELAQMFEQPAAPGRSAFASGQLFDPATDVKGPGIVNFPPDYEPPASIRDMFTPPDTGVRPPPGGPIPGQRELPFPGMTGQPEPGGPPVQGQMFPPETFQARSGLGEPYNGPMPQQPAQPPGPAIPPFLQGQQGQLPLEQAGNMPPSNPSLGPPPAPPITSSAPQGVNPDMLGAVNRKIGQTGAETGNIIDSYLRLPQVQEVLQQTTGLRGRSEAIQQLVDLGMSRTEAIATYMKHFMMGLGGGNG